MRLLVSLVVQIRSHAALSLSPHQTTAASWDETDSFNLRHSVRETLFWEEHCPPADLILALEGACDRDGFYGPSAPDPSTNRPIFYSSEPPMFMFEVRDYTFGQSKLQLRRYHCNDTEELHVSARLDPARIPDPNLVTLLRHHFQQTTSLRLSAPARMLLTGLNELPKAHAVLRTLLVSNIALGCWETYRGLTHLALSGSEYGPAPDALVGVLRACPRLAVVRLADMDNGESWAPPPARVELACAAEFCLVRVPATMVRYVLRSIRIPAGAPLYAARGGAEFVVRRRSEEILVECAGQPRLHVSSNGVWPKLSLMDIDISGAVEFDIFLANSDVAGSDQNPPESGRNDTADCCSVSKAILAADPSMSPEFLLSEKGFRE
ncbi:hypothetical protein HWV62_3789 [Athelia sp. TMB]|nr:hypothetical protein HWV62_3789 [Athelia sp. TMB]